MKQLHMFLLTNMNKIITDITAVNYVKGKILHLDITVLEIVYKLKENPTG